MADPKARTDIKAEIKTEPLDSQDTKSVQDLTIFVSSDVVYAAKTLLYSPGIRPNFIFTDVCINLPPLSQANYFSLD